MRAMEPTAAEYETLARAVCQGRGIDPDEETKFGGELMTEWEQLGIDEDENCADTTRDTLDAFRPNSKNWREPGRMQEVDGGLYWAECQAQKGQRRCELCVVDCGEFRLIYQV